MRDPWGECLMHSLGQQNSLRARALTHRGLKAVQTFASCIEFPLLVFPFGTQRSDGLFQRMESSPSSEQRQLGDQIRGGAWNGLEERVLEGAGVHGNCMGAAGPALCQGARPARSAGLLWHRGKGAFGGWAC